jgi:hypothetical protein
MRMHNNMNRKGQTATEAVFVVLFVSVSIIAVYSMALDLRADIGTMAGARAIAQGVALEMTLNGTTTYLIRIDELSDNKVGLHVASEDCGLEAEFDDALGGRMSEWDCFTLWQCGPGWQCYNTSPSSP